MFICVWQGLVLDGSLKETSRGFFSTVREGMHITPKTFDLKSSFLHVAGYLKDPRPSYVITVFTLKALNYFFILSYMFNL